MAAIFYFLNLMSWIAEDIIRSDLSIFKDGLFQVKTNM